MIALDRPEYLTPDALRRWIPALVRANRLYRFYKTPEFLHLRQDVIAAAHGECEDCRARSPSEVTPATCVHHDKPVKLFPELALARYWIDSKGRKRKQLWALCDDCHNRRHDRFGFGPGCEQQEPLTPERW